MNDEELAFDNSYLMAKSIEMEMNLDSVLAIHAALGTPASEDYKQEVRRLVEERMRICGKCPRYVMAVWSDKED